MTVFKAKLLLLKCHTSGFGFCH